MKLYPFIEAEKAEQHTVRTACVLLEVSRAAYYQWSQHTLSPRALANLTLTANIAQIHQDSRGTYGVPRILAQLRRDGIHTGPHRVARLMRERGLVGRSRRRSRRTTIVDPEARTVPPDLLRRDFAPHERALNTAWVGDIERHEALLNREEVE